MNKSSMNKYSSREFDLFIKTRQVRENIITEYIVLQYLLNIPILYSNYTMKTIETLMRMKTFELLQQRKAKDLVAKEKQRKTEATFFGAKE